MEVQSPPDSDTERDGYRRRPEGPRVPGVQRTSTADQSVASGVTNSSITRSLRSAGVRSAATDDGDAMKRLQQLLDASRSAAAGGSSANVARKPPSVAASDRSTRQPAAASTRIATAEKFRQQLVDNIRRKKMEEQYTVSRSIELERYFKREARAARRGDRDEATAAVLGPVSSDVGSAPVAAVALAPDDDSDWWRGAPAFERGLLTQTAVDEFFAIPAFLRPLDVVVTDNAGGLGSRSDHGDGVPSFHRAIAATEVQQREAWQQASAAAFEQAKRNVERRLAAEVAA